MTSPLQVDEVIHADLTEQTYRLLRDRILRREIEAGQKVSVDEIAQRLGVSRTPVTDALKRLANDGLVEIVPRRGTFVTQLRSRDAREMFDVRLMIELQSAMWILESGHSRAVAAKMQQPLARMGQAVVVETYQDYEGFIEHDRLFHRVIVSAVCNNQLLAMYDELNAHMYVVRAHYVDTVEAAREAQAEHQAIQNAFASEDRDLVTAALVEHISRVRDRIGEIIARQGGFI